MCEQFASTHEIKNEENSKLVLENILEADEERMVYILEHLLFEPGRLDFVIVHYHVLPQRFHGVHFITVFLLDQKYLSKAALANDGQYLEIVECDLVHFLLE